MNPRTTLHLARRGTLEGYSNMVLASLKRTKIHRRRKRLEPMPAPIPGPVAASTTSYTSKVGIPSSFFVRWNSVPLLVDPDCGSQTGATNGAALLQLSVCA